MKKSWTVLQWEPTFPAHPTAVQRNLDSIECGRSGLRCPPGTAREVQRVQPFALREAAGSTSNSNPISTADNRTRDSDIEQWQRCTGAWPNIKQLTPTLRACDGGTIWPDIRDNDWTEVCRIRRNSIRGRSHGGHTVCMSREPSHRPNGFGSRAGNLNAQHVSHWAPPCWFRSSRR